MPTFNDYCLLYNVVKTFLVTYKKITDIKNCHEKEKIIYPNDSTDIYYGPGCWWNLPNVSCIVGRNCRSCGRGNPESFEFTQKKPAEEENTCYYCYRTLNYKTHEADFIVKEDEKLPMMQRPMNASVVSDIARREIEAQKHQDYIDGLTKIAKELNL